MSDIREKIKRQIEILGLVIAEPEKHKIVDLEVLFNCNQATIKRDLKDLRALGIDIHSVARMGVRVEGRIKTKILNELIKSYTVLSNPNINFDKPTHFLASSKKDYGLTILTNIQHCIDRNLIVKISYKKQNRRITELRTIKPIAIFYGGNEYRLLANEDDQFKQFLLGRIQSVEITDKKFKSINKDLFERKFNTSLDVWLGDNTYKIKLLLMKPWYKRRKLPLLTQNQIVYKNSDGSTTLEAEVNSLTEVSQWIVSQGRGIKVIKPPELRKLVLSLAKGVIENYKFEV